LGDLKHEVEYLKQAVLGDIITVKTWGGKTKGFKSERLMEFYKNNQLLVQAKTGKFTKMYLEKKYNENLIAVTNFEEIKRLAFFW
jgi:acyl-CoA thioester hydrolase